MNDSANLYLLNHQKEFSRKAASYDNYNIIQKKVAIELLENLKDLHQSNESDKMCKKILDLGCGRGEVLKNFNSEYDLFVGVDLSLQMCEFHPKNKKIKILNYNFDDDNLYKELKKFDKFDICISSSALQWSKDLEKVFKNLSSLSQNYLFAIFTKNTFKEIYDYLNLESFLKTPDEILFDISYFYECKSYLKEYVLEFEDTLSMFRYIKNSGVSGGKKILEYSETKNLINNFPSKKLNFEVLFLSCTPKQYF